MPIAVEGVLVIEGEPGSGDGRMFAEGSVTWDPGFNLPIIWDREDGDHTGMTVGWITEVERRDGGKIWGIGALDDDSQDPATQLAILRVAELLDKGIGGSICWDSEIAELRVRRELLEMEESEIDLNGVDERVTVAKFAVDDALKVVTHARLRHFAIVDTGAWFEAGLRVVTTGAIAAAGIIGDWSGLEHLFDDPKFGDYVSDSRSSV